MINLTNLKLCLINFVYFFSRHQVLFSVYFLLFEEYLSEHSNQLNYLNLVASLCMRMYENQQIHSKTGSWSITFEYNQSGPHNNRMA